MGGSQRVRPAHFFVAFMQTFAQSNCVFTPRFALTYKYLA